MLRTCPRAGLAIGGIASWDLAVLAHSISIRSFNKSSRGKVSLGAGNTAGGTRHMDGEHMGRCGLEVALERFRASAMAPQVSLFLNLPMECLC
jgi:hypothetical protein